MKLRDERSSSPVGPGRQVGIGSGTRAGEDKLDGVTVRWLQYAGLQHLASPVASPDDQQLLHDLLLQGYRDHHSLLLNSIFKDNNVSSSVNTPKVGGRFGNGLLDLESVDDDTGFLSEDATVEPFDLLPVSPPKGIIRNNLTLKPNKASSNVKQSNIKGKNVVKDKDIMVDLFPISPPKGQISNDFNFNFITTGKSEAKLNDDITRAPIDRKKIKDKGKIVSKHNTHDVRPDFSILKPEEYAKISYNNIRKSEKRKDTNAKHRVVPSIKDVAVVDENFESPTWSPTRGLYGDFNLLRGEESKRNSDGPDCDFEFMRGVESKKKSSSSSNSRVSHSRRTHKSKEKDHTNDKMMEVKHGLLEPAIDMFPNPNPNPNPSPRKGLNNEFDSIMEELSKWSSSRSARSSSVNKTEIASKINETKTTDLDDVFSVAMEEMSKLQSIRSARSSSTSKKDFISNENNSAKFALPGVVLEQSGAKNNEFNSAIEELSKWHANKSVNSSSAHRKNIISKQIEVDPFDHASKEEIVSKKSSSTQDIKAEPVDFLQNFSPKSKENNNSPKIRVVNTINEQIQVSTPRKETKGINSKEENSAKIRVVIRKRPLNKKEISKKEKDILCVDNYEHLTIHEPKLKVDLTAYIEKHEFNFDAVLDEYANNHEVYNVTLGPIMPTIFEGAKITCFAFGQTGSGKTFTMQPLPLRASRDIIQLLHQSNNQHGQNLKLWVSYFEIYGKKIIDLLNDRRKLCIREDGNQQVCIVGLQEFEISDAQTIQELISKGNALRSIGSTGANEESSRSHSILQLAVKMYPTIPQTKRKSQSIEAKSKGGKLVGKLSFIDLAGSERGADSTHNDREKRNEGVEINKSLLALKECIRALDNDQNHVPFRGSKLTEVLRDSFLGDSRTVMICCVSPSVSSCEQTLNSLRYAERVKNLLKGGCSKREQVTSPVLNEPKDIFEQDNQDQEEENYEIMQINDENYIYNPATEIGETSFRFMPNYNYLREGDEEEEQLEENGILGQNKMDNANYDSSLDFGTQNLLKVFSKNEHIDGKIKTLIEEERNPLSPFLKEEDSSFDELDEDQVPENHDSNFHFITNPNEATEEQNGSNLSPKRQEEALYEEGFSSDNGDIKTILEENDYKESIDKIETDDASISRISSENEAKDIGHEAIQSFSEEEEQIDANHLGLGYEFSFNQNQINHQNREVIQSQNNIVNTTKIDIQNISSLESNNKFIEKEEKETKLSPLEIGNNDLQVISSSSSPSNKSEASTQNSLNITENRKQSNKSPHKRTPREERTKKKRNNLIKENKMEGSRREWPISTLFQEEEALLAAHRKVIQNTMHILREELNMLAEVDQPGSFINNYVSQLSFVLSRKAADLAGLQTRVVRFQQCLGEQDKLGRMSFP